METKKFIVIIIIALPLLFLGLHFLTDLLSFTEAKLYEESNITIGSVGFCEVEMFGDYSHTFISAGNCKVNGTTFGIVKDENGRFELNDVKRDNDE